MATKSLNATVEKQINLNGLNLTIEELDIDFNVTGTFTNVHNLAIASTAMLYRITVTGATVNYTHLYWTHYDLAPIQESWWDDSPTADPIVSVHPVMPITTAAKTYFFDDSCKNDRQNGGEGGTPSNFSRQFCIGVTLINNTEKVNLWTTINLPAPENNGPGWPVVR